MARVLVPLAEGFEETEAVTTIDVLRRGGLEVVVAALAERAVTGNHGITLTADTTLEAVREEDFDMVVLPGGLPGADHLEADPRIIELVRRHSARGRHIAAICAAPKVLAAAGIMQGRRATSFPGFLDADAVPGLERVEEPVVIDGKVVTSRGPGTAMDFALVLVSLLAGESRAREVEARLERPHPRYA
jgi:4-methyl-5(b-hydroxyethyl)-thiazole monophosphate biosynthesis